MNSVTILMLSCVLALTAGYIAGYLINNVKSKLKAEVVKNIFVQGIEYAKNNQDILSGASYHVEVKDVEGLGAAIKVCVGRKNDGTI